MYAYKGGSLHGAHFMLSSRWFWFRYGLSAIAELIKMESTETCGSINKRYINTNEKWKIKKDAVANIEAKLK